MKPLRFFSTVRAILICFINKAKICRFIMVKNNGYTRLFFSDIHDSAPINVMKYPLHLCDVTAAFLAHLIEVEHVKEVHRTEHHQHNADLGGEILDRGHYGLGMSAVF